MKKKIFGIVIGFLLMGVNVFAANGDLYVNGNVGIGTTTNTTSKLYVKGSSGTSGAIQIDTNGQSQLEFLLNGVQKWALLSNGNDIALYRWPGSLPFYMTSAGNLGIGTTNPGSYKLYVSGAAYSTGGWQASDIRYKENIAPIESPLNKILNINGVSFSWTTEEYKDKGFPEGRHYGVIAQEVEKVLPEVVKEGPGGEKAVAYTEIVPVLIEAMKEQQKEIEELRAMIKQLRAGIYKDIAGLQP